MRVFQTIDELGLENKAIAIWSEPTAGQWLKPRFGSRHLPKKPIYAILILFCFLLFGALINGHTIHFQELIFPIITVVIAWPLIIALDRLHRRNIWVYSDRILVTHARDRTLLPKTAVKQIFLYRTKRPTLLAMELLSVNGKSTVVGLPNDAGLSDLLGSLHKIGYQVNNGL